MTVMLLIVFVPILVGGLIGAILSPYIERAKVRGEAQYRLQYQARETQIKAEMLRMRDKQNKKNKR